MATPEPVDPDDLPPAARQRERGREPDNAQPHHHDRGVIVPFCHPPTILVPDPARPAPDLAEEFGVVGLVQAVDDGEVATGGDVRRVAAERPHAV